MAKKRSIKNFFKKEEDDSEELAGMDELFDLMDESQKNIINKINSVIEVIGII